MSNSLQNRACAAVCDLKRHRPKGWTPERRARQAAAIRTWQPWRHTTGPRTDAGKARCVMNALRHGFRSREHIEVARMARHVLRVAERNLAIIRAYLQEQRFLRCIAQREVGRRTLSPVAAKQRREMVPQDRIELSTYPLP